MSSDQHRVRCQIITPERVVIDEAVDSVVVPLYDGEMGVFPLRAPAVGRLRPGEARLNAGSMVRRVYVDGGFVQVRDDTVIVLTQHAALAEELADQEENLRTQLEQLARRVPRTPAEEAERDREIDRVQGKLLVIRRARTGQVTG